jgi:hypothetical protein
LRPRHGSSPSLWLIGEALRVIDESAPAASTLLLIISRRENRPALFISISYIEWSHLRTNAKVKVLEVKQ